MSEFVEEEPMRIARRGLAAVVFAVLIVATAGAMPAVAGPPASAGLGSDFNADGWPDLAIGIPGDRVGGLANAGSVLIMYGSFTDQGVSTRRTQVIHQNVSGVLDVAEAGDRFGASVATGDFNGDGYHDLAVGIPGEDTPAGTDSGAFQTFMGSANGLTQSHGLWSPGSAATASSRLGTSLVAVDMLNSATGNDGRDTKTDIAVGAPGWNQSRGRVLILAGGYLADNAGGLALRTYESSQAGAEAGTALARGDFDGEFLTGDELAIGEPGFDIAGTPQIADTGRVMVLYDASGTTTDFLFQRQSVIADDSEAGDRFGEVLAAGDINGDDTTDLVVGTPGEDVGALADAGRAIVILASTDEGGGFASPADSFALDEGTAAKANDRFGASVAIHDFGQETVGMDIAVGVPGRAVNGHAAAGRVMIWQTQNGQVPAAATKSITQDTAKIGDVAETGDQFGSTLWAAHLNASNGADLIIGAPMEDIGSLSNAGLIHFVYGQYQGLLSGGGSKIYRQGTNGVPGDPKANEVFGSSFVLH
jgi:hypothetical protein